MFSKKMFKGMFQAQQEPVPAETRLISDWLLREGIKY
jgi:hypothetical protein